jgi:hypothetical protein
VVTPHTPFPKHQQNSQILQGFLTGTVHLSDFSEKISKGLAVWSPIVMGSLHHTSPLSKPRDNLRLLLGFLLGVRGYKQ